VTRLVAAAAGDQPPAAPSSAQPPGSRFAALRFVLSPGTGRLAQVAGVERARQAPRVVEVRLYREPGQEVTRCGDFRDRIGHVIACHESSDGATAAAEVAHRLIQPMLDRGTRGTD
jgi:S-sulfo-L-cysteine synthase (3-phospho-L-serine-dependent)